MLHPRLTSVNGTQQAWLASIGPTGSWGDLGFTTRWGDGACGMFEAKWSMPLPPDFDHPLLRLNTKVELFDGPVRVGSSLTLSEPARGSGFDAPWQFVATGVGRAAEGDNSFAALDLLGNTTTVPTVAVSGAIGRGLPWADYDAATIPASALTVTADGINSVGSLLSMWANGQNRRWIVGDDDIVRFVPDPTTPTWQTVPGVASLGVADDDYATVVLIRFIDSSNSTLTTVAAPASPSAVETRFGRREFMQDLTTLGPISVATAAGFANGILAKSKGRLQWTDSLTVTSNELLSMGGVPADLSMVKAGEMVRLHGVFSDLIGAGGQTYTDIIIGETQFEDGSPTLQISPLGLAARSLAAVVEEVTGMAVDAA